MEIPIVYLIIVLFILILLSAFFSGSETGFIAANRYRVKALAINGNKKAKLVLKLLSDIDSLLGTILLGNNFVNILSASIATIITIKLFGEGSIFIASILLTIIILIFAETAPKTFAAKNPEKTSLFSAVVLNMFVKLLSPIVFFTKNFADVILKILNIKQQKSTTKLELEELKMSILDTQDNIDHKYQQILLNIVNLQKIIIDDIMIPKNQFVGINLHDLDEAIKIISTASHTRLIVYENNLIIGIVHMREIANLYAQQKLSLTNIKQITIKPYFIPEGISLAIQLEQFQKYKERLGFIVDEYGDIKGMIALEDILEEIVGQFTSNTTEFMEDMMQQQDGSYIIDPNINLHKLNRLLNLKFNTQTKTLNGLILENLQSMPGRDISLKIENTIIEIIQIKDNNIKLVKLTIYKPNSK